MLCNSQHHTPGVPTSIGGTTSANYGSGFPMSCLEAIVDPHVDSPVQMMPSRDQIGVPIHFHSSTTSGSASLMSLRILPRVSPRQSPSSAILFEMSSDADWPWLAPEFFMFSAAAGSLAWESGCQRLS